ncbi:MAG TPA: 30S ribosomal protein S20 [Candidatus Baltobacteraceae bacterium]|nr:30S ribosomal protein S20 [Candidatus Baltobacteraceae bacterium]
MPNIKAAEKWVRQTGKRTKRNLDVKTRLKTVYKKAAETGEATAVVGVESQFDKAAQKGIIHPNKAARKKSRLAKAAKIAGTAPAVETKKATAKSGRAKKKSAR